MAPKIYNIKEPLNLDRLRLAKPINKNGTHFIKTLDVDNPIYFLGPKCFAKQGFVKSGKKIFCDLVFSNEDSDFLAWLENLEETARGCIYANRETWFETPLDEHDIESSMSPPYKPYKSGKYFIVRANVPTALDKINIKVYDENENESEPENIKENTKILAVLEFQGIRCSVRSFQFEIELKQILIVEPEKIFEKCIIARSPARDTSIGLGDEDSRNAGVVGAWKMNAIANISEATISDETIIQSNQNKVDDLEQQCIQVLTPEEFPTKVDVNNTFSDETPVQLGEDALIDTDIGFPKLVGDNSTSDETQVPLGEVSEDTVSDVDLQLDDIAITEQDPPLKLKSRNDVYYKLYKEMRQRAKESKREALANYLEAKRIKNTFLLNDVSDSETDEDWEERCSEERT